MSINKRNAAVARTLQEIKNSGCQHGREFQTIDLDTADTFCGNCGATLESYRTGWAGRFPGRLASDLIIAELQHEIKNENVQTQLFSVDPIEDGNKFEAYMQVHRKSGTEHRHYRITRTSISDDADIERTK